MNVQPTAVTESLERAAADRLLDAARSGVACAPVRELIGPDDLSAAYRVQRLLTEGRRSRGCRVVGRKIGLTSPAVQQQMGVHQPDFGVLFDDMAYVDGDVIDAECLMQPKVEAEVAFVLRTDLVGGDVDVDRVRDAVEYAVPAIEVCDSRIDGWDISFADTVADNASAGVYVLGTEPVPLDRFEPSEVTMRMLVNGVEGSRGHGSACLGDPLNAVAWLAAAAARFGDPLRAGQVILSGALGPMYAVAGGDSVHVDIGGLGTVTANFGEPRTVGNETSNERNNHA